MAAFGFRFQKSVADVTVLGRETFAQRMFSAGSEDTSRVWMVLCHESYQLGRYLPLIVIRQLGRGWPSQGARVSRFSLFL